MSSMDAKVTKLMASKLGIDSNNVIRKSGELMRLLQLRTSGSGGVRLAEACRTVLCLHLACSSIGVPFNKEEAIRLAGVTKKAYSNGYHTIEKLLELSAPPSVSSITVQLGVGEVGEFAERLLEKYVEMQSQNPSEKRKIVDLSFPMYHTAAIYVACKHFKVKVDQGKLLDLSRIKKTDFKKLSEEFVAIKDHVSVVPKQASKRSNLLLDLVEKYSKESELEMAASNKAEAKDETEEEDFELWKKRLLGEDMEV